MEKATLGGGCFWCLEALYQQIKGIESVVSGYAGGHTDNPDYDKMHAQDTGHAEVNQLIYDPSIIAYRDILEIFFVMHDPTTLNRQGNDVGTEYRSIILYHDDSQKEIAEKTITEFATPLWDDPIVTEVKALQTFWPAEDYHQDFYANNPNNGYCQFIINPKIQKLRQKFQERLKSNN